MYHKAYTRKWTGKAANHQNATHAQRATTPFCQGAFGQDAAHDIFKILRGSNANTHLSHCPQATTTSCPSTLAWHARSPDVARRGGRGGAGVSHELGVLHLLHDGAGGHEVHVEVVLVGLDVVEQPRVHEGPLGLGQLGEEVGHLEE